ncbi:hypothetical protein CXB51_026128 [Gossypium anomalum]|uniref:Transposase-associated domain-containing protein n=1 Tax=Gossypium anomalum TaxID=47600 RepID=A0A8J5Y3Z6_9ROSI|nr:hypothetical protein CXB51_026128 [Gossypium anomalum]
MDRNWMNFSRASNEYQNGVQSFLDFAIFHNSSQENMILCPCKKCGNIYWHYREVFYEHLIVDGFIRGGYRQYVREDDMEGMTRDAFNMRSEGFQSFPPNYVAFDDYNIGGNTFMETRSVLDEHRMKKRRSSTQLLREMFPFVKIPQSCKDMKKVIKDLGLRDAEDVNEDEYGPQLIRKPNKILRYFPLISRLQRLFMSSKTAEFMTWHHDQQTDDGLLRHPIDSLAWKSFDNIFLSFASDPRSPLIEELKQLWAGVETYDVLRKENFYLRAALLWTINDFPAYANLSGWSTRGRYACPCCAAQTCSQWLYNGKKFCYIGHRRWLDENHRYRFQRALFDSTEELKKAPEQTIGSEILFMLKDMDFSYGKLNQPSKRQTNRRSRDESDDEFDEEDDPNEADLFLSKLKSYYRNKRYPEGSIAEGYLAEERMTFCSRYLEDVETRLNRPSRNVGLNDPNLAETYSFQSYGEPIGKVWSGNVVNDEVKWLSQGPNRVVKRYSGFIMNGFRFHTKYRERLRRTQNCGVVVNSLITSYASARDSNPVEGNVEYYGLLTDIIELDNYGKWKVVLFRCDWADANTARGIKNDQFGFTMVNFSRLIHTGEHLIDEPYVFSSQVKQVFSSKDPIDKGWYVVLRNTPRDLFDMGNGSRDDIIERSETLPFPEQDLNENIPSISTQFQWNITNSEEVSTEQQTVVGSSSVPETFDEPVEFQTENGGTRRGRRRTLLTVLYNLNSVEHVKVTRNSHGQPVGQEARLLAGYLGIIARNANMLPINYESWHNMPDSNKNQALSNIKERFALEVSDAYIKKALGKKWRDHKSILKKESFEKPISLEEKLQNVPPRMLRYQWEDAVRFWNSKKGEDRERVGTSSRQKQKFTHTVGSRRSLVWSKVGRLQLFDITHRKKDGTPMTSEAAEIMEKLKDKKAEYEATASTDSSVNFEDIDNRIINEVLGPERYGRVRFQGSGVNPTQYFGSTSHQYMPSGSQSQAEVQRLKDQIVQIQASTDEQISQLRAEAAAREAEQNRKYNELQLQLQSMMTMFQQFQNPPS